MGLNQHTYEHGVNSISHRMAIPKLVAPPPPHIHARQPIRFAARVALFTVSEKRKNLIKKTNFIPLECISNCIYFII